APRPQRRPEVGQDADLAQGTGGYRLGRPFRYGRRLAPEQALTRAGRIHQHEIGLQAPPRQRGGIGMHGLGIGVPPFGQVLGQDGSALGHGFGGQQAFVGGQGGGQGGAFATRRGAGVPEEGGAVAGQEGAPHVG